MTPLALARQAVTPRADVRAALLALLLLGLLIPPGEPAI
jgi:hypothetical protein